MADAGASDRDYGMSLGERLRRHLRLHFTRALLVATSAAGVVAGFLSAAGVVWPLLVYVSMVAGLTLLTLIIAAVDSTRIKYAVLAPGSGRRSRSPSQSSRLELVALRPRAPVRQIVATRCDDPVYGSGFRTLLDGDPAVIVPSNPRDVGKPHELLFPLFAGGGVRSHVDVDVRPFGIPIAPYSFERELPDGVQDVDHSLAAKDIVFLPELVAAFRRGTTSPGLPVMWLEHCVDPEFLAQRDVVVVGGPDTNFWHAALFEPVARQFERPESSVPLALSLCDREPRPRYGSRALAVTLKNLASAFSRSESDRIELDERIYPAYGMILACRNPYADACGLSRWCVFVAGTRSLGTCGAVLALTAMVEQMKSDPNRNYASGVPTSSPDVVAPVSAVLCRTVEVERATLRRGGGVVRRTRVRLPTEGLDPYYSDSYIPTEVQYLDNAGGAPVWEPLVRLSPPPT